MRRHTTTVPSSYQKLDSAVTAADAFVNVRDEQIKRLNHNILLARRIQHTVLSMSSGHFMAVYGANYITFTTRKDAEQIDATMIRTKVLVPAWTQRMVLRLSACKSALTEGSELNFDPVVYADIWNGYARKVAWPPSGATISAAHGSPTSYSITINLPPMTGADTKRYGRREFEFGVWVKCMMDYTQKIETSVALADSSINSVTASVTANLVGNSVHFGTDLGIEERQIVKQISLGGGAFKLVMDRPMSRMPDVAADSISSNEILGIDLYSLDLRCLPITDFQQEYSL